MRALLDIFAQVFRSIGANKLRSFLTMFGIAWGVASLLLLIGLGEGFRSGQRRSLSRDRHRLHHDVRRHDSRAARPAHRHAALQADAQRRRMLSALQAKYVRNTTALINRGDLKEVSEFSSAGGAVMGVEVNFPEIRHLPIAQGRFLNEDDIAQRRQVVVLGQKNNKLLFPGRPSLGAYITLNGYRFQVIGVAEKIGRGNNDGDNQKIYIPLVTDAGALRPERRQHPPRLHLPRSSTSPSLPT